MKSKKTPMLTKVEMEIMQIIWEHEEIKTEAIQNAFTARHRDLTGGAIRRMLNILVEKDHVTRRRIVKSYYYRAKTQKHKARSNILKDILVRAFEGSVPGMVSALLDLKDIDDGDVKELKKLIAKREREIRK